MNAEQRIKQIADEAIEKIKAIAADKEEWPKVGDYYSFLDSTGRCDISEFDDQPRHKARKARRRIAPNTPEGRARLEKLAEWEVFFADFMTAGDAEPGEKAYGFEVGCSTGGLVECKFNYGAVGQRGFTTEAKRGEWLNKWGRDYVEKMLKGGMP